MLSDIPQSNILCLQRDEGTKHGGQTFGANIVDMLSEAFFLEGTMGDIAQSCINEFVEFYFLHRQHQNSLRKSENSWQIKRNMTEVFEKRRANFDYVTSIVGEEYLQKELREMYDELVDFYDSKE